MTDFDAIILGMGPGGEAAASRLLKAGKRVAVVERELIGGECAYWACIPSKTLLRPPEALGEVDKAAGIGGASLDWAATRDYRDYMIRHLDDSDQVKGYAKRGARVFKGVATVTAPQTVDVDGETVTAEHVVVATGSDAFVPPIDGLDDVTVWTNREATTLREIPQRTLMVGGSAVGVELGQFLARFGTEVTIAERSDTLLSREEPRVGELIGEQLANDGVTALTGVTVKAARKDGADTVVSLDDGSEVRCDVVVVGTGRNPRTQGLGLENAGVDLGERGEVRVDEHCRAADGVWALGDVTGIMPFTHVAMYQARVVTDNILGRDRSAHYNGIPRVVFTGPEVAAVGLTTKQATDRGVDIATTELDLANAIARPWTYEKDPKGTLGLLADRKRNVLIGAWAVAPQSGEWIHQAALAIRAEIPIDVLLDQVAQFPTYSEGYLAALEQLGI